MRGRNDSYMLTILKNQKVGPVTLRLESLHTIVMTKLCMIDWLPMRNLGHEKEKVACINREVYEISKK